MSTRLAHTPVFSTIILASNNPGKCHEFNALFAGTGITLRPQAELDVEDVEETGLSFVENAIIKARHACQATQLPAIADDSGLEIDALNGEPGIYSARYAGEPGNNERNKQLVLEKLSSIPEVQRTARFQCVLAFMRHAQDPTPLVCQASWEGRVLTKERGDGGFGYDPLFWVPDKHCSAAELPPAVKNSISHRARALHQFLTQFQAAYLR